jgi:formate hydrogenlyase subunit 3/multisubunit Na+/H+ antiporter MnhD subunit
LSAPTLLLVALCCWTAGAVIDLVVGAGRLAGRVTPYLLATVGAAFELAAGVQAVASPPRTLVVGDVLAVPTLVRVDGLAGAFLVLLGALGVCVSAAMTSWVVPEGRVRGHGTGAGFTLLLGAVAVVVVAGDAFTFLFAWESVTVALFALSGVRRRGRDTVRGSWAVGVFGKASGAALLLGIFLLVGRAHGQLALSAFAHLAPSGTLDAAWLLLVLGFGAKVGLVPFEVWLPPGYRAAPGPARAAMAGLAANIGYYGLWRFLGLLRPPPLWLDLTVLLAGGLTGLLGITFAAVERRLARLVAGSSVENAGLILVGYGTAMVGRTVGATPLEALGLLAASLQLVAHAVAKSGVFAASAFVESDAGTDDLDELRGVRRDHPFSAAVVAVCSLSLAGLPPTVGFVSEWFVLESLMQEFRLHRLDAQLAMATTGALVALTAGLAAFTFARLVGLSVLGGVAGGRARPRRSDGGIVGGGGLLLLGGSSLGLGAAAPWLIRGIALGLVPVVPAGLVKGALRSPAVLQPVYAGFSILSPSWLFVVLPLGTVVVGGLTWAASRSCRIRRVPPWRSAGDRIVLTEGYSSFGYAQAVRHVLANVLGARRERVRLPNGREVPVRTSVREPVQTYLYRPARLLARHAVAGAKALQSGRLDLYVLFLFGALVAVLLVAVAVH